MSESVKRFHDFVSEMHDGAKPRIQHKQEISGRANCQLSDMEEGALAQSIKGNGNIQIVCKEFKLIAEQPIVLQFNQADGSLTLKSLMQGSDGFRLAPADPVIGALAGDERPVLTDGDDPDVHQ